MLLTRRALFPCLAALPAIPACAFGSKDFWETKPSTQWSGEEVDRMLTRSPWAKDVSASFGNRGNGGGFGQPGGSGRTSEGIGFPGGGVGFPGGGGIGFPGGGQRPSGGADGDSRIPFNGTVRWESAQPVQEALRIGASDEKPNPDFAKYYVIRLLGNDINSEDDENDERKIDAFRRYTRLERKDGALRLEKVEQGSRVGSPGPGVFFYFLRHDEIAMDDKAVTFSTRIRSAEIRARFVLKEMLYQGKLAL